MFICFNKTCACNSHLRLLECIKNEKNDEAKSLQQQLQNIHSLSDEAVVTFFLLHYAVKCGNTAMVQHLIDVGYIVDAFDDGGCTPLMISVHSGHVKTTEVLLNNNANIYVADDQGVNSIDIAVEMSVKSIIRLEDRFGILTMIFEVLSMDFLTDKRWVAQMLLNKDGYMKLAALVFGSAELSRFVLKNVYVNFRKSISDHTPLHWAVIYARLENAKVLIEHGAPVDEVDTRGNSPLYYYVDNSEDVDEDANLLKILLNRSATSYVPHAIRKITDMDWLLMRGNVESVRTALRCYEDISKCLSIEMSLVHLLVTNDNDNVLDVIDEFDVKFYVSSRNVEGRTALMTAASMGCVRKVELLLKHGADVNSVTANGYSALYLAMNSSIRSELIAKGHFAKTVETLLQRGADPQLVLRCGSTIIGHLHLDNSLINTQVLAYLALLGSTNESAVTSLTRNEVEVRKVFKALFDIYTKQLDDMKNTVVHGAITLYKLLTVSEEKLVGYARNRDLVEAFDCEMERAVFSLTSYYVNTLQKRMKSAIHKVRVKDKAASVMESLTGLCNDAHYGIVQKIMGYLDGQCVRNLCNM